MYDLFRKTYFGFCCLLHLSAEARLMRTPKPIPIEGKIRNWCEVPDPPLKIVEAFKYEPRNGSLWENNFNLTRGLSNRQYNGTTVFAGCIDGYTAVIASSAKNTCTSDASGQISWNGTFPKCERNICWWLGAETDVEIRYNNQLLADPAAGFPEGSVLSFKKWTACPLGTVASNATMLCQSNGTWSGTYPICVPEVINRGSALNSDLWLALAIVFLVVMVISLAINGYFIYRWICPKVSQENYNMVPSSNEST